MNELIKAAAKEERSPDENDSCYQNWRVDIGYSLSMGI